MTTPHNTPSSESPVNSGSPTPRAALLTVFLVVFIDLLGFGIVLPLMPLIAKHYFEPAGIPEQLYGLTIGSLLAVFSLMQFIFAPVWGRVSDRVGRKPILLLGLVGSVIFYALFGFASSLKEADDAQLALILMFISRIGAGIAGATIATAQAVIADCTPPEKRAHGMALIGAAFGIGFTFGPILGGLGNEVLPGRLEFAGYAAAGLSLVALLIGIMKMPETRKPGVLSTRRNWIDLHGLFSTLKIPTVGVLVLTFFLATFGFAKFESTLAVLADSLGYRAERVFWIFAYVGFVLMFTQGYLYRKLKNKYHEVSLIRLGVGFMFLGLAGLAAVAMGGESSVRPVAFFVSLAFGVVGFAFMTPSIQALISRRSDPARQGEVLGVNQSFSALARILGPIVGNVLFFIPNTAHVLPYVSSAVLLALVLALLTRVRKE